MYVCADVNRLTELSGGFALRCVWGLESGGDRTGSETRDKRKEMESRAGWRGLRW